MTISTNTNSFFKIQSLFAKYWPCLLILLAFFGFISKALYNYPTGLMAILGLYRFLISPKTVWLDPIQRYFILLFLCVWLPMLASFPDAYNHLHTAETIFPYIRLLFCGLFIIQELSRNENRMKFVILGIVVILAFWSLDATAQFFLGSDLFGYPYNSAQGITGMFYPRNTISHICSILSPFYFLYIYQNQEKRFWLWLTIVPLFFVVFISGRRAAWIMLALNSIGFFIYLYLFSIDKKRLLRQTAFIVTCISLVIIVTILFHKPTNQRFKVTLGLFSNNYETVDKATARRLPIWDTALNVFKSNPINGVGPRGFRHAYHDYSSPDNYWVTQTHPHLLILEILAETGLIGFAGYLLLLYLLIKQFYSVNKKTLVLPFFIPVLVALFPFNSHMAFYGSIWSSMIWLLLSLYFSQTSLAIKNS